MNNGFPSDKIMKITLGLLFVWYLILFYIEGKNHFTFLRFDFSNARPSGSAVPVRIDSFSYDLLRFRFLQNKISLHPDTTYALSANRQTPVYFRFIYQSADTPFVQLNGLRWIPQVPINLNDTLYLQAYDIPVIQKGQTTVMTLGDEWIYFNEAKNFRRFLAEGRSFRFLGSHRDLYGYPAEADYKRNYAQWDSITAIVPRADYYIVFLDEFCKPYLSEKDLTEIFNKLVKNLEKHRPRKIYWINFPLNPGNKDFECHQKINRVLEHLPQGNWQILNTDSLIGNRPEYWLPGRRYLNAAAYRRIANELKKRMHD